MGSVNKVTLIGNLGRDAEMRYTTDGTAVATLNLATTETWKDRSGAKKEKTEWHRVVLWGKTAESLERYLVKGKQIYVEGSLTTRKWEDKSGTDRFTTEIKAYKIVLLGGDSGNRSSSGGAREDGRTDKGRTDSRDRGRGSSNDDRPWDERDGLGDDSFLEEEWQPPV